MDYRDLVEQLTPELYATFKRSLERGYWPDGRKMSEAQRENCLQAIIAYDQLRTPEHERVGYVEKTSCSTEEQPLRWREGGEENP